jgi:HD superfamily phosphohydrolase
MMVFARYVMFSEVYWHHAVRAATAMLQRAFFTLSEVLDLEQLLALTEQPMIESMLAAAGPPERTLLDGLFGPRRSLYKRLTQYSHFEEPEMYRRLARRPYPELVAASRKIAAALSQALTQPVAEHEVLVDAPPTEREVDFNVDVYFPKQDVYRPLGEISPMVRALAREQFDDYVKRVRIFVHPRIADSARRINDLSQRLAEALD